MIKTMLWTLFLLPWTTLFWAKRNAIKRYMPVTVFTSFLMTIVFQIAYTYKWWIIHQYIVPWGYMIDVSFAYGLFAVGTFWLFTFTYNRFSIYFFTNVCLDAFLSFLILPLLGYLGVATLKNITEGQYFLVILTISLIIYAYQKWQEGVFFPPDERGRTRESDPDTSFHLFPQREKAR